MSVAVLNAVSTQDNYVDALTVEFPRPRSSFSLNVFNAAVYYQVGVVPQGGRGVSWEALEHHLAPSLSNFRDPSAEGFGPNDLFAGIRVRSAVSNTPAVVSVA